MASDLVSVVTTEEVFKTPWRVGAPDSPPGPLVRTVVTAKGTRYYAPIYLDTPDGSKLVCWVDFGVQERQADWYPNVVAAVSQIPEMFRLISELHKWCFDDADIVQIDEDGHHTYQLDGVELSRLVNTARQILKKVRRP